VFTVRFRGYPGAISSDLVYGKSVQARAKIQKVEHIEFASQPIEVRKKGERVHQSITGFHRDRRLVRRFSQWHRIATASPAPEFLSSCAARPRTCSGPASACDFTDADGKPFTPPA
jgi:hypothetical protein